MKIILMVLLKKELFSALCGSVLFMSTFAFVSGTAHVFAIQPALDMPNRWTLRREEPPIQGVDINSIRAMTFGMGLYVGVGMDGKIVRSSDAKNWVLMESGIRSFLSSVAFGNGQFIGLAEDGTLIKSVDGTNWISQRLVDTGEWGRISFSGGLFFAASDRSVFVSSDGSIWNETSIPNVNFNSRYFQVTHGNGVYVGIEGANPIAVSMDGTDWDLVAGPANADLNEVAFAEGRFVAVGRGGVILTSVDGTTWNKIESGTTEDLTCIAYGAGRFVVGGGSRKNISVYSSVILSSEDGAIWRNHISPANFAFRSIVAGEKSFVAVASGVAGPHPLSEFCTSESGIQWKNSASPSTLLAVTYGRDLFVAVGRNGTILNSRDGAIWIDSESPTSAHWNDVTCANGQFVTVGSAGAIATSSDGIIWNQQRSGTDFDLTTVTFGEGKFIAGGALGKAPVVLFSDDGTKWSEVSEKSNLQGGISDMTYGAGRFIGVGYFDFRSPFFGNGCYFLSSTNGLIWDSSGIIPGPYPILRITFGKNRFVAWGDGSFTLQNPMTNSHWSLGLASTSGRITGLGFGNDLFIALMNEAFLVSADGKEWVRYENEHPCQLNDIVFAQSTFVAVGENGAILQSDRVASGPNRALENAVFRAGNFSASVQVVPGERYVFEYKKNLDEPEWSTLSLLQAENAVLRLSDFQSGANQRFYRIRKQ